MENVPAGETVGGLEILGCDDLDAFDEAGKVWRVCGKRVDDGIAEFLAARVPVPFPQFEGGKLNVSGQDMLAVGRQRWIENRGDGDVKIGRPRKFAVLGGIEGVFEVIDFGADVDASGEGVEKTFLRIQRRETRKTAESKIDFGDSAVAPEIP